MARNPSIPVKTPGVQSPAADEGETDMDALEAGAASLDDGAASAPAAQAGGETKVTLTVAELQHMIAAEVNRVVAAQRPPSAPLPEPELPDQSEIDTKAIVRPTLSKQGYVVPEGYGEPVGNGVKRI